MIKLEACPQGVVLPVRAHAGARSNGIPGEHAGALRVSVTQAPEKGKANNAIVAVLAKQLGWPKSQITLVGGATSTQKRFMIVGMDIDQLRTRIDACLG